MLNINTSCDQKKILYNTQKKIIDTASHLFSEYGYFGVSMNDIAKKLNITKAALYYHFTSKSEIYKNVLDKAFCDLKISILELSKEKDVNNRLRKLIYKYLEIGTKEKNLIKAIVIKMPSTNREIIKHITNLRSQIKFIIKPIINEIFKKKKISARVDSDLLTSSLLSTMDGFILEYSFLNKKIEIEKLSNQITDLFIQDIN